MLTGQPRALVVEDDEGIREVLRDLLEDAGYAVQDAADGEAALAILRTSAHGLVVVLDNLLPGLDGAELLAALHSGDTGDTGGSGEGDTEAGPGARHAYVLVTASPQKITPELAARLARLSAPVVAKPFDIATLIAAVDEAAKRLAP